MSARPTAATDEPLLSHPDIFRRSVPVRVAAYYVFLGGAAVFSTLGVYPTPIRWFAIITAFETVVLLLCYRRARESPTWAVGYLIFEGLCLTAMAYALGDLRVAVLPTVYTAQLVNSGVRLKRLGHYVVASIFAGFFAVVVYAEQFGLLPQPVSPAFTIAPGLTTAQILLMFMLLNCAAFYISEVKDALESKALALSYAKRALQAHGAELERRVRERTDELERAYRFLREKDDEFRDYVYAVTHDLKNRINAITIVADMIERVEGDRLTAPRRAELRELIDRSSEAEDMLRDLLELFSVTSAAESMANVELGPIVEEALAVLSPQVSAKDIRVTIGPLARVRGQPAKLGHLFRNLLANAVKYVPSGKGEVSVTATEEDDQVLIRVSDNGVGIPQEWRTAVFDLFRRAPHQMVDGETVKGGGIGLAIVRRVAEGHSGSVWVESPLSGGSCFCIRLPRTVDTPPAYESPRLHRAVG